MLYLLYKYYRAACYQKLMEFQRALEDSEMCIKLDPDFSEFAFFFIYKNHFFDDILH